MQDDIRDIKTLLAKLIGTDDLPPELRFSEEALNKAAAEYVRLCIDRGDWVKEREIVQYIKTAPWNAGIFIRKEFAFANWRKRGHEYFYAKKDLIALGRELEARNIDLK